MSYPIITGPILEGYALGSAYSMLSGMQSFVIIGICNIVSIFLGINMLFDMPEYIAFSPAIIPFLFNYSRYDKKGRGEKIIERIARQKKN
jgi:hypothetical protein